MNPILYETSQLMKCPFTLYCESVNEGDCDAFPLTAFAMNAHVSRNAMIPAAVRIDFCRLPFELLLGEDEDEIHERHEEAVDSDKVEPVKEARDSFVQRKKRDYVGNKRKKSRYVDSSYVFRDLLLFSYRVHKMEQHRH